MEHPGDGTDWKLRTCENPWKPNIHNGKTEVYRRMLGILNRVTEQSLLALLPHALELPITHPDYISVILNLILTKAQDEPLFINVYAIFCSELIQRIEIKESLVEACWNHFIESLLNLLDYDDINQIQSQNPRIDLIQEEILTRKRLGVYIAFICCLERRNVVPFSHLLNMAETLLSHGDWRSLDCLCRLLSFSGERFQVSNHDFVERCCTELENKLKSGDLSQRMIFLVQDTLALKSNGWRRPIALRSFEGRTVRG